MRLEKGWIASLRQVNRLNIRIVNTDFRGKIVVAEFNTHNSFELQGVHAGDGATPISSDRASDGDEEQCDLT